MAPNLGTTGANDRGSDKERREKESLCSLTPGVQDVPQENVFFTFSRHEFYPITLNRTTIWENYEENIPASVSLAKDTSDRSEQRLIQHRHICLKDKT